MPLKPIVVYSVMAAPACGFSSEAARPSIPCQGLMVSPAGKIKARGRPAPPFGTPRRAVAGAKSLYWQTQEIGIKTSDMNTAVRHDESESVLDPITLEVIRHGVVSITDQIDANITRTAFSPYIYEYRDFAVGLVGPDGELIAQCRGGMPVFVADSVGMAVRDGIAIYGRNRLHHGDVLVCNHAAVQGQHLNNTVMYTPIFTDGGRGSLIGFF